jgi:hypothetical protein
MSNFKLPYNKLIIGLDQLFFSGKLENMEQAQARADLIDTYLAANGWDWDSVLAEMFNEKDIKVPPGACN